MPTADSYLRLLEQQRASAPSSNTNLTSRLDSQAQQSITGGVTTTNNRGQKVTSNANTGVSQPIAAITNYEDQARYAGAKTAFEQGGNQYDAAGLATAAQSPATVASPYGGAYAQQQAQKISQALQGGAQVVGGYVIDDRGVAIGRADSVPGGRGTSAPVPEVGAAPTGGGGGGTPAPTAPTGPGAAEEGATPGTFGGYTEAEIEAALQGIEAEFGMTREQLLQDKSMIGAQYRLLMARMNRARIQAQQAATSDAVSRGIYRSGILGENIADVEQQFTEETSGARQQQTIQEQGIERQLAFLDQGKAAAGAQAQNRILGQAAATMTQAGVTPRGAGFGSVPGIAGGGNVYGTLAGQGNPYGQAGTIPRSAPHIDPGFGGGQVVANPYQDFPEVGGYYIDPNTGMAVARVDGAF